MDLPHVKENFILFSLRAHPELQWVGEAFLVDTHYGVMVKKVKLAHLELEELPPQSAPLLQALKLVETTNETAFSERLSGSFTKFKTNFNKPEFRTSNKLHLEKHLNRVNVFLEHLHVNKLPFGLEVKRQDHFSSVSLSHCQSIRFIANFCQFENEYHYKLEVLVNEKKAVLSQLPFRAILLEKGWFVLNNQLCFTNKLDAKFLVPFTQQNQLTYSLKTGLAFATLFIKKQINNPFIEWRFENIPHQAQHDFSEAQLEISHDAIRQLWSVQPIFQYHENWITINERRSCFSQFNLTDTGFSISLYYRNLEREQEVLTNLTQIFKKAPLVANKLEISEATTTLEALINQLSAHFKYPIMWKATKTYPLLEGKVHFDLQQRKKGATTIYSGALVGNGVSIPLATVYKSASGGSPVVITSQLAAPIPAAWRNVFYQFKAYIKAEGTHLAVKNSHTHLLHQLLPKDTSKDELPLPEPKNALFRPYQRDGIRWLQTSHTMRSGVLLADDMGLGKTLQVLSFLNFLKQKGKLTAANAIQQQYQLSLFGSLDEGNVAGSGIALVLVPVSLLFNWYNEGQKFYPNIRMYRYYGSKRQEFADALQHNEVILTSYSTFRNDFEQFKKLPIAVLVMDEAHILKNSTSKTHQFVRQLQPEFSIALSGTPIENAASDLWALFRILSPGLLGNAKEFERQFPSLKKGMEFNERDINRLKTLVAPYVLRRTKEEVAKDLPELDRQIVWVEMTESQKASYEKHRIASRKELLAAVADTHQTFQVLLLTTITKLRQIANHPGLINESGDSGKLERLTEDLLHLIGTGKKVLVFSSFIKHLAMLQEAVKKHQSQTFTFTGSDNPEEREQAVRQFMKSETASVLFMTLKAGGVGLNLTEADYVLLIDPWWNPQAEEQAIARAHRIGTKHPVTAVKYLSKSSIEERIFDLQQLKTELAVGLMESNIPAAIDRMAWIDAITGA